MRLVPLAVLVPLLVAAALAVASSDRGRIEATDLFVPEDQAGEEFARCDRGKRAVGGGVVQSGTPREFVLRSNGPLDSTAEALETTTGDVARQWYAYVSSSDEQSDRDVRVFAICAPNSKAVIKDAAFLVDEGEVGEKSVKCGRGKRALGGGVIETGSPSGVARVVASGPLDASGNTLKTKSGDVPKQWYAAYENAFAGDNRVVKVFAICAPDSDAKIKATTMELGNGETAEAFARCGKGKRALGGGIVQSGSASLFAVHASGPLDASGVTLNTDTGDLAKQWYAAILNISGGADRVVKVFAICAG